MISLEGHGGVADRGVPLFSSPTPPEHAVQVPRANKIGRGTSSAHPQDSSHGPQCGSWLHFQLPAHSTRHVHAQLAFYHVNIC